MEAKIALVTGEGHTEMRTLKVFSKSAPIRREWGVFRRAIWNLESFL